MSETKDKYDLAIEYLTERPEKIMNAWRNPSSAPAGCLFQFANKSGCAEDPKCGCLTGIKNFYFEAATPELTVAIKADSRIPELHDITAASLPIFAEWQRRIDKELGRV